jgi:hypothetical protein
MRLEADSQRQDRCSEPSDPVAGEKLGHRRRKNRRALRWITRGVLALAMVLTSAWALLALYFDGPQAGGGFLLPAFYFLSLVAIWMVFRRRRGIACGLTFLCFGITCAWWLAIPASNDRDWQLDVAVTPFSEQHGNKVMIHNIRHCTYRSESDYDVRHYDKTFDLEALRTVDLYLVYWGSPLIAHTMASFGFTNGEYVCISIETRKEKGEEYSALRGFFRQFELVYVIADESDLVRLRTNFRNEEVFLYRIRASADEARAIFLDYLKTANELNRKPKWYNALTDNCTTNIRVHSDRARGYRSALDWRIIVNGYSDRMLYGRARIDTSLGFEELKERSRINARARVASEASFSREIREGLPGMKP